MTRVPHDWYCDWDLVTNEMAWSDALYEMVGLSRRELKPTYPHFLSIFHRDDCMQAHDLVFLAHDLGRMKVRSVRVVHNTGAVRTILLTAEPQLDSAGTPIRLCMTLTVPRPTGAT